ncbi:MAG: cyclic nucleotide-binding domain-containing protein [Chloroflexi bacterium]|nr:cyclic nucleotide-binding domain-containing protein [Chloroflexota bacterium]
MVKNTNRTIEYANILRQADIFYDLTGPQLEMVAVLCSEITPKNGEIIFEENSTSDELYVIASGAVEILVNPALVQSTPTGQSPVPVVIATIRRGQTFGEVALVDQGLRSASARCAAKKTRLLIIPSSQLIDLCDADSNLGYRLMRNIAADLAFKIRGTDLAIREQLLWGPTVKVTR